MKTLKVFQTLYLHFQKKKFKRKAFFFALAYSTLNLIIIRALTRHCLLFEPRVMEVSKAITNLLLSSSNLLFVNIFKLPTIFLLTDLKKFFYQKKKFDFTNLTFEGVVLSYRYISNPVGARRVKYTFLTLFKYYIGKYLIYAKPNKIMPYRIRCIIETLSMPAFIVALATVLIRSIKRMRTIYIAKDFSKIKFALSLLLAIACIIGVSACTINILSIGKILLSQKEFNDLLHYAKFERDQSHWLNPPGPDFV